MDQLLRLFLHSAGLSCIYVLEAEAITPVQIPVTLYFIINFPVCRFTNVSSAVYGTLPYCYWITLLIFIVLPAGTTTKIP